MSAISLHNALGGMPTCYNLRYPGGDSRTLFPIPRP